MEERWSNDGQTMEKEWSCKPVICDGISMDNWKMTFLRQYLALSDILIIFAFGKWLDLAKCRFCNKTSINMTDNFSFFTFSVFFGCTFEEFSDVVMKDDFWNGLVKKGKAYIIPHDDVCLDRYFNPEIGATLEQFTWWSSELYPNIVFLSSNQGDGLYSGCYNLRERLKCESINCVVATKNCPYPKMSFYYTNLDGEERVVMALKEDRWTFFQQGEPLPFENLDYYNNKRIKDKINFEIIKEYLLKLGIDFYKMDSSVNNSTTFVRTAWGR